MTRKNGDVHIIAGVGYFEVHIDFFGGFPSKRSFCISSRLAVIPDHMMNREAHRQNTLTMHLPTWTS